MKTIILTIFLIVTLNSYSQDYKKADNWTMLEYEFVYSSVPPPYHYNYVITVTPDLKGKIKYILGYVESKSPVYNYDFTISKKEFNYICSSIKKCKILSDEFNSLPKEEWKTGGTSDHLRLIYESPSMVKPYDTIEVNEHPKGKYGKKLEKFYEYINTLVPMSTWAELKQIREDYINKRKDN